jgi:uncharacterized tellurite resistance protein B-like protein
MIERIKSFFSEQLHRTEPARHSVDELQLAAAALLVEAACQDKPLDESERETILALVRERFRLDAEEAATLLEEAETAVRQSSQLFPFTHAVNRGFSHEERIELIEMLWEVVYADRQLHEYEANLLRRIGGLIYVTDQERGAARKRVLARIGLKDDPGAP